jgi:hypothetical protein
MAVGKLVWIYSLAQEHFDVTPVNASTAERSGFYLRQVSGSITSMVFGRMSNERPAERNTCATGKKTNHKPN